MTPEAFEEARKTKTWHRARPTSADVQFEDETVKLTWSDVRSVLDWGVNVYDINGIAYCRSAKTGPNTLLRADGTGTLFWHLKADTPVWVDPPPLPEPPDGTRIEFEHATDVYAAWRDDASSGQAGYPVGDGGEVWCLYGSTVPRTWMVMWLEFGDSLATAVRLIPVPEDVPNYAKWPTAQIAAAS